MSVSTVTPSAMTTPVSLFTNKPFEISIISAPEANAVDSLVSACTGMCQLGFKLCVLPKGNKAWQDACFEMQSNFPDNFVMLESNPKNQEESLKKSQIVLFPATPSSAELKKVQKKGIIAALPWPSCEDFNILENFDAQQESGNCFLFTPQHSWDLAATMIRAFENYKFSYDWNQLKKRWKETKI